MDFIDQAPAYRQKTLSLKQAIQSGRAKVTASDKSQKLAVCWRPELAAANAFDKSINTRVKFNELPTEEKLDLMIEELLPGFYHPQFLPLTGQDSWIVRFVVDGNILRTLKLDAAGIHTVNGQDWTPAFELETDIMTLMAILTVSLFIIGYGFRGRKGRINRFEGAFLVFVYLLYTSYLIKTIVIV